MQTTWAYISNNFIYSAMGVFALRRGDADFSFRRLRRYGSRCSGGRSRPSPGRSRRRRGGLFNARQPRFFNRPGLLCCSEIEAVARPMRDRPAWRAHAD